MKSDALQARSQKPSKAPRIGIVGAGIAGLRCADILLRYGFEVTILEARDRIGGRVHQIDLPSGHIIDLGPNWVHGTEHNPILDLANETHTPLHKVGALCFVLTRSNGIPSDFALEIYLRIFFVPKYNY